MRKKALYIFAIFLTLTFVANTAFANDWYIYKGSSETRGFSINFPSSWQAFTLGDYRQGFAPIGEYGKLAFEIIEFEHQTYIGAINYFLNENTKFIEATDFVMMTDTGDILAKKAVFQDNETQNTFAKTLIKRGSLVLALNFEEDATKKRIHDSFAFTDNWQQYIDTENNFTFVFPKQYGTEKQSDFINLYDPNTKEKFFTVRVFPKTSLSDAIDLAKDINHRLDSKIDISFSSIKDAIAATYINLNNGKKYDLILFEKDADSYALTNINLIGNYPHKDYYDRFIEEILESFEFFDIEGGYSPYLKFPDVRENHQNAPAINYLANFKVISGYPDGTFKPDEEINRAELSKMVIEAVTNIDEEKYKDCFPDVKDEWYAGYVCYAKGKNWVAGYEDGTFKPGNQITRAEAMKIILEVIVGASNISETEELIDKNASDIDPQEWYIKYFTYLSNRNFLDKQHIERSAGLNYEYKINENISRKEVAQIIYNLREFL